MIGRIRTIELPYGSRPLVIDVGECEIEVLEAPALPPVDVPVARQIDDALARPIGGPALAGRRVTVIVSDATRAEPRAALVRAVRDRIAGAEWTIAIATGTHGPSRIESLGIPDELLRGARIVNHDGQTDCVELGTTARGTPVRVHRCVVDADLVVATGCVRPHYFAGFGAGAKAIFPGLGETTAIRTNHRWKTHAAARAGVVDGNPCREDLEEAVARVATPKLLLNGVCGPDDEVRACVAGDVVRAFRAAAELARPWFAVRARPAPLVVASDRLPVAASLYQAAKIAAAVAPLVAAGGTLAIAAECAEGIGPLDVVNEAIFRIGVLPRLAPGVRLALVSSLPASEAGKTLFEYTPSIEALLGPRTVIVPRASHLICEARS